MNKDRDVFTGIGIADVIQTVFIILKLCKVITWSWWWVLSPFWISLIWVTILSVIWVLLNKNIK